MDKLLFVLMNLLAFAVADGAASVAMAGREPWRRWLAALAGFPVVVLGVVLILGAAGRLSPVATVILLAPAALLALAARWRHWRRSLWRAAPAPPPPPAAPTALEVEDILGPLAFALLAAFGGVLAARAARDATVFGADDLSYHAAAVAHWLADGRLSLAPNSYQAYYPFNAETLSLWFCLPFHADAYASLTGLYWVVLALAAMFALGRIQGTARSTSILCAALFVASPVVVGVVQTFSAVDVAGPALVLAAIAFAAPSPLGETGGGLQSTPGGKRRADAVYSGLLAGFAVGCKVSFAPVALLLFLWWLVSRHAGGSFQRRWRAAAVFAVAAVSTGAYWYARNVVLTGNPIFPAEIGPLAGPFTPAEQDQTRLITYIKRDPFDWKQWVFLGQYFLKWPFALSLVALVGFGAAAAGMAGGALRRAPVEGTGGVVHSGRSAVRPLLLAIGLVLCVLYPFMPFSGTVNDPDADLAVIRRYLVTPFAIGLVLFSTLCESKRRARPFWWALALLGAVTSWPGGSGGTQVAAPVVGGALLAAWFAAPRLAAASACRALRPAAPAVLLLVLLVALAAGEPAKQRRTDAALFATTVEGCAVGDAWHQLEKLPAGSRVAYFGHFAYKYYPTFGREFDLLPAGLERDGSPYVHLHLEWRDKGTTLWALQERHGDLDCLLKNLEAAEVDYVLVTKCGEESWPPHRALLASWPGVQPIYDDGCSALWKIKMTSSRREHRSDSSTSN